MSIVQSFYNGMATQYDKLFADWQATTREQACLLDRLFRNFGYDEHAKILDCACGIGTQAIGLAARGYCVTGSDISDGELAEAGQRAEKNHVKISLANADFRCLSESFSEEFDIVICMDNALPHMLTETDMEAAIESIAGRTQEGGMFVASIRDYDALLAEKPSYSPPYIHPTEDGQRVCLQTWKWEGNHYQFTQYIIEDGQDLQIRKFDCEYRAIRRDDLTKILLNKGFREVTWKFPEETGFYQPIVIARKER